MKEHSEEFSIERMAGVLKVSRAGYYAWRDRDPSERLKARDEFDKHVKAMFKAHNEYAGRDKLTDYLRAIDILSTRKRVGASMKRLNLKAKQPKKFIATTDSKHPYRIADNLLARNFTVHLPNTIWVTDITYLRSVNGWLYLTTFIDLFSRKVVGWEVSSSLRHEPVVKAFKKAALRRGNVRGLIIHSDRGVQYCCDGFRDTMALYGCEQSMSRKGDCWDNAVAESFFSTLKRELVGDYCFTSLEDAKSKLFEYIEIYYNRARFHSHLGSFSPDLFEEVWERKCA